MNRQTLTSLVMILAMAGMVGTVALFGFMIVGDYAFSPALFFAIVAAGAAAVALFVGVFRDDDPSRRTVARTPKPKDRDLSPERFTPGRAGVEPGSAGVEPGSVGRKGPGASLGAFGFAETEGDKPSTAAEAPGPASAADQMGNAPSSAHGGMPSGNVTRERGTDDDARPHGRPTVAAAGKDDDRIHAPTSPETPVGVRGEDDRGATDPAQGHSGETDGTESQGGQGDDDVVIGTEPPRLSEPRGGAPDDLTRIDGIDGEIDAKLHRNGIHHFDQIAAWNRHEIVWIEEYLGGMDGRIDREDWTGQADRLSNAPAPETEESRA